MITGFHRASCIKCNKPIGDKFLKLPKRDRICSECNIKRFEQIKKTYSNNA